MRMIPNFVTLVNLFLGCVALVFVFDGSPGTASLIIVCCSLLDFLDGAVARWLKAWSETGKQLDSLADLVSFGVAPAAIMYHYLHSAATTSNHGDTTFVWSYLAFLIAACSALRLARFNVGGAKSDHFYGLPAPASALLIASIPFVLAFAPEEHIIREVLAALTTSFGWMLAMTMVIALLLISRVRMFSLKATSVRWQENRIRYLFLAGCIILLITFGLAAAPLFLVLYIFLSLADHLAGRQHVRGL